MFLAIREPGDLPFERVMLPVISCPNTEVVMALTVVFFDKFIVSERVKTAVFSLILGAFLVWGAGLSNSHLVHDVAHDTRHSYGFPCH